MEIASRVIRGMRLAGEPVGDEQLACAAWPQSVGRKVAAHTRAARMVRTRLVVEVEDRVWQRQLFTLSAQILGRLEKNLGRGVVEDLEFRVVPRRREPGRAAASVPALIADEAAGIEDPVLRSIYRASRNRAQA
jgi:predicted nucleic acid-binding Zn ribbon protein